VRACPRRNVPPRAFPSARPDPFFCALFFLFDADSSSLRFPRRRTDMTFLFAVPDPAVRPVRLCFHSTGRSPSRDTSLHETFSSRKPALLQNAPPRARTFFVKGLFLPFHPPLSATPLPDCGRGVWMGGRFVFGTKSSFFSLQRVFSFFAVTFFFAKPADFFFPRPGVTLPPPLPIVG